jgi:type II secretory ATPase GspE/PulE/Tfp pilus assembly ATPase PilB-like protein
MTGDSHSAATSPDNETYVKAPLAARSSFEVLQHHDRIVRLEVDLMRRRGVDIGRRELLERYGFAERETGRGSQTRLARTADGHALRTHVSRDILQRLGVHLVDLQDGVVRAAAKSSLTEAQQRLLLAEIVRVGFEAERIEFQAWDRQELMRVLRGAEGVSTERLDAAIDRLNETPDDGTLIHRVLSEMMAEALQNRASDVHVWHRRNAGGESWIVYRIDGDLRYRAVLNRASIAPLATRLKTDAGIDAADIDRPQDGRFSIDWQNRSIDIRVHAEPIEGGEDITMRLLDRESLIPLDELFHDYPDVQNRVRRVLRTTSAGKSGGFILISGATGSGKSTTLYAMVMDVDRANKKVITIEQPVEYVLPLIVQTPVLERPDRTWSVCVRNAMRRDPDYILLGELRDSDTAEASMAAAASGHVVMTTTHANNCTQSIERISSLFNTSYRQIGLGILASSLIGVMNQRLVKRVCGNCSTVMPLRNLAEHVQLPPDAALDGMIRIVNSEGCPACHNGYRGRALVAETMFFDDDSRIDLAKHLMDGHYSSIPAISGVHMVSVSVVAFRLLCRQIIDAKTYLELVPHNLLLKPPSVAAQ